MCALAAAPGRVGHVESIAQIMARSRAADAIRSHKPVVKTERETERDILPQDPAAPAVPSYAAARQKSSSLVDESASAAQTVSTTILGATLADTGAFPPDSMGAAGPKQFVVAVNGRVRTFDKDKGVPDNVLDSSTNAFFEPAMTPPASNNFASDPHIRYDRLSGRWFIVMIDVPGLNGATPNRVMIAVSSGPVISATTTFAYYYFQHDTVVPAGDYGAFADYPTLGIDANALYIGDNVYTSAGFKGCSAFVIQKSSLLGGGPMAVKAFRGIVANASSEGPYTPQGVDNYDPAATEGWFIGVSNVALGRLVLRRVINPGSGSPTLSTNIPITVPTTAHPNSVPHLGNTGATAGRLDPVDDRLFAAHLRNGRLWTAHNIQVDSTGAATGLGARTATRWYELKNVATGQTPALAQSGTLFDPATSGPASYFIPSVMVSGQGHAALGFTHAGSLDRIDAGFAGRLANDPPAALRTPTLFTASTTAYNPLGDTGGDHGSRRWGDYSYTSLDPTDDMTMWTIAEFNDATDTYGVEIAKLLAPPPATPSSASASIMQGQNNVDVVISGASINGSGFYDPGADPAGNAFNHLRVSVGGSGVTVNSVVYVSPTSLRVNLSAAPGAAIGARGVTVTNPDGQSVASAAILAVTVNTGLFADGFE